MLGGEALRLLSVIMEKAKDYGLKRLADETGLKMDQLYNLSGGWCTARCYKTVKKVAEHIGCMDFYTLFVLEI